MSIQNQHDCDTMENLGNMANPGNETLILAVETSSRIGSVAIALGDRLIEESTFSSPMQHSAEIFPAIQGLLMRHGHKPEDIGQIHLAIGPGSFTGLRIAVTLAKAMHLALGVQIVTVDSLDVVVANLADIPENEDTKQEATTSSPLPDRVAAVFDAKRGQFYASIYDRVPPETETSSGSADTAPDYRIPAPGNAIWRKIQPDSLLTAQEIIGGFSAGNLLGIVGDGLLYHREEFARENVRALPERYWGPRAANVYQLGRQKAQIGRFEDPLALTPFYLRGPQVTLKKKP